MADSNVRAWTFEIYTDSAPENWMDVLDEQHLCFVVSPLHSFDTFPTGEVKKPHYHVVLTFEGKKSYDQIMEIVKPLGCNIVIRVQNMRALVRYFVHLDNPEKYQYSISDIRCFGGFDYADYFKASTAQRYDFIKDMCQWCIDTGCIEFSDLTRFAMECHYDDWFPLLCDNSAYVIQCFIKSLRHKAN